VYLVEERRENYVFEISCTRRRRRECEINLPKYSDIFL